MADVGRREAGAQPPVERERGVAQSQERGLAGIRQLDHVDAAVDVIAAAGEQAIGLHRVQMMGERGLAHTDGRRQLALVGQPPGLHVQQHQPHR